MDELPPYLRDHWPAIREQLLTGRYQPSVVKRVEIPKPGGGVRMLGIPTVLDRFIQQAVLTGPATRDRSHVLGASYGFRPGRSAHDAVCQAQRYVQSGRRWVVDVDLAQFFDRVNHDILMGLGGEADHGPSGADAHSPLSGSRDDGVRRGGGAARGDAARRSAVAAVGERAAGRGGSGVGATRTRASCATPMTATCTCESQRAAERVMEGLVGLYAKLKLRINPAKSAVAPAWERSFLGLRFWVAPGKIVKRRVAPKAIDEDEGARPRRSRRGRWLESRAGGGDAAPVSARLEGVFPARGDTRVCSRTWMDGFVADCARCIVKQCKRGPTLFRVLRARGVPERVRAGSGRRTVGAGGRWRRHGALSIGLSRRRTSTRSESRAWALHNLNSLNRRMRTRMSGGVGGK